MHNKMGCQFSGTLVILEGKDMKRCFILFLVLLMMLCCVSCAPAEKQPAVEGNYYNFETDDQSTARVLTNTGRIVESEKGFYFVSATGYLFFTDKSTMETTLLCNRPECLHQKQGSTSENPCNAYVGYSLVGGPFYYEGNLYCITEEQEADQPSSHPALTQISLDGTQRKVVWKMNELETTLQDGILHRGKFFYIDSNEDMSTFYLRAYDLKSKKVDTIYENDNFFRGLRGLGDAIYWREPMSSPTTDTNRFLRYSTIDGTITSYDGVYDMYFDGEKVFFFHYKAEMDPEQVSYWFSQIDLDGGNQREVSVDRQEGMVKEYRTDGKYLYEYTFLGGGIHVYDYTTFQFLKTIQEPEQLDINYNLICADGKVFLFSHEFDLIFYCTAEDIASEDFAWKSMRSVEYHADGTETPLP